MKVPFNFAMGTGEHKSVQFGSELTRNLYLSRSETSGQTGTHDFPGLKLVSSGSGVDRGHHVMSGVRYVINANTLFSEDAAGNRTNRGTVPGDDRAVFADDGTNLYMVTGGILYKFDGSAISTVNQTVVSNPKSIIYINKQFLLFGEDEFAISDVGNGDTYNSLNFAEAETQPDKIVRGYYFNQQFYAMGARTVELWYNSGEGTPPITRKDTALVNVGIGGLHAVTNSDQYMYWFGDDRKVYQCFGSSSRRVNTSGISHIVENFTTVDDCIASSFVYEGQDFILFKFPAEQAALLYSETNDYWVELGAGTSIQRQSWYGSDVQYVYGKNLVTDYRNGNTYELDADTYTDNGDTRRRIIELPSFSGDDVRAPGKRIQCSGVMINMQVGVGLTTGQGVNPVIMCELSNDGGHTWGAEQHVEFGELGNYTKKVAFDAFANGYRIKLRLSITDPVYVSMFDGVAELREAGY